jgi:hypothetical protein
MKNVQKIVAVLMLLACSSFASFFLDNPEDKAIASIPDIPALRFGATFSPAFYLNSFGFGGALSAEYRLHKKHSVDIFAASILTQPLYEVGLNWRFFFSGDLKTLHHEDFFLLGASMVAFESFRDYYRFDEEEGFEIEREYEYYYPPRASVGYGRDMIFFDRANFLCRIAVRLSCIFGESIPEADAKLTTRKANFVLYFDFSIFFF